MGSTGDILKLFQHGCQAFLGPWKLTLHFSITVVFFLVVRTESATNDIIDENISPAFDTYKFEGLKTKVMSFLTNALPFQCQGIIVS